MFDQIISSLKEQAGSALMSNLGLNEQQTDGSITAAADSAKEVLSGGDGFGMDDVMNLFSSANNSSGADGILSQIGTVLLSKLTGQVGLDRSKASDVSAMLLPMLTNLITEKSGGNADMLKGLLGGNGGGIADVAKGMLGNLFK
ncbi:MAG: hypothetical protein IPI00_02675 [Flavobacteriales bacterium]|nr:hypothetical protein [Flavobacteriales bacterium]MBK6945977.1 hypothetical protein [Flavobacteriales bacterium]MBK7239085.1 hypothetical protein [Flavobacteriales bacterium]MBK7296733.1 hypothetical protein [Flavobacteriales bacterium]MBK9536810.1 hypothetical protein [Flavobacteriales bacterium]